METFLRVTVFLLRLKPYSGCFLTLYSNPITLEISTSFFFSDKMQASWSQWGAQAAAGVAANATSYSMPPPTPAASTATTATAAATQATPGVNAFSMGAYGLYNAQAAAMTPAMNPVSLMQTESMFS